MAYETDVLIIGAGPTGSTTALALANSGVRCHIVSRGNWMADSPRAHITNQRANEVFRDLGISEDVARYASPWELMGDTTFTTSLAGPELIRMRTWGTGDDRRGDYLRASPCGMVDIIQPLLEPILFQKAAEKGATFAFNTEYIRHEQDSDGRHRDAARSVGRTGVHRPGAVHGRRRRREIVRGRSSRASHRRPHGACGHRLHGLQRRPLQVQQTSSQHPELDRHAGREFRRDRHGPSPRRAALDAMDRRLGVRHQQGGSRSLRKQRPRKDQDSDRRSGDRTRHRQDVGLVHQPSVRDAVFEGARFVRRRRRPSASAVERSGQQHLRAGRPQSRLETRLRRQGLGRPEASGKLFAGAGSRRKAGRAAGQPVAARLRSAERLFPRPGRRESGGGGHRALSRSGSGGCCRPQSRSGSARPQADRVQRPRRRDEPAVRILGRRFRTRGRSRKNGGATATSTISRRRDRAPRFRTHGSSVRTVRACRRWT